jgi:two-component system response regulator
MNLKTILLVEDNPDDVQLARRAFRTCQAAAELVVAGDGQEALDYLLPESGSGEMPRLPTLVLLDLKLPRIHGWEVLKRIRATERVRRLPVVVLSSSTEQQDIARSYDLGANSYIRKPVDFDQFVEAVRQLERYWLMLNEHPYFRGGAL